MKNKNISNSQLAYTCGKSNNIRNRRIYKICSSLLRQHDDVVTSWRLVSLLLTLNRLDTLSRCFHSWPWTSNCRLGYLHINTSLLSSNYFVWTWFHYPMIHNYFHCQLYRWFFLKKMNTELLTLSLMMLKNGQTYFKNFAVFHTARFLKYVWSFFNIIKEKVKHWRNSIMFQSVTSFFSFFAFCSCKL